MRQRAIRESVSRLCGTLLSFARVRRDPGGSDFSTLRALQSLRRPFPLLIVIIALCVALDVVWLLRFRWGYPTEWDESGYLSIGVRDANALNHHGVVAFARAIETQPTQAPLVPAVSALVFSIFGSGMGPGVLVVCAFTALLLLATYGVGRQIMSTWWAVLATLAVGTVPLVIDYSRIFHFSVPAAAFLTASIWGLLRSDRLGKRGMVILSGFLLGLMVLSRTMTIAYLPSVALAAFLQVLGAREAVRSRLKNALLGSLAGVLVAASWYAHNWRSVVHYLSSAGYGNDSARFGKGSSILFSGYWTRVAGELANELYLPLTALVGVCLCLGAIRVMRGSRASVPSRQRLVATVTSARFTLVVVVLGGYAALSSSRNEGTAFPLPWIPALVLLAVAAASLAPTLALRRGFAAAFVVLSIVNLAMKSGFVPPLAGNASAHVPVIGDTTILQGKGIVQTDVVEASGFPPGPATSPFARLQKDWPPFERRVVELVAASGGVAGIDGPLDGFVATASQILSNTSFALAAALLDKNVGFELLKPHPDTEAGYRKQLRQPSMRFLITAQTPSSLAGSVPSLPKVARAARATGYRPVEVIKMPDGNLMRLWLRASVG